MKFPLPNPGPARARLALLALAAALGLYLILGPHPWEHGVYERVTHAGGRGPRVTDYATIGLWFAALLNLLLALALAAAAPLWARPLPDGYRSPAPGPRRSSRAFAVGLGAILLLAAWLRLPCLQHSLWNDEEYALRRYVWGYLEESPANPETLAFRPVDWSSTLFRNRGANNHLLFSLSGRLSLDAWRAIAGAPRERFDEGALRAPSFLAGLGAIAALGFLVAGAGGPAAGLGAALLLALHPWHIRFSAEAKGYSLLLLMLLLATLCLRRALADPRWRWWLLFALAQALSLLSFPGAIHFTAAQTLCAGVATVWARRRTPSLRPLLSRLVVADLLSAMLFLQWMAPSIPQIREHLGRPIALGTMGFDWWLDLGSHMVIGLPFINRGGPDAHLGTGFHALATASPLFAPVAAGFLPALVLLGLARLARLGPARAAVFAPFFLGPLFAYLHTSLTGNLLYSWYLLYALPGVVAAASLGATWPCELLRHPAPRAAARLGAVALAAVALAAVAAIPIRIIRTIPRQPMREAAALARPGLDPASPEAARVLTAAFGTSNEQLRTYDPRVHAVETRAELEALVRRARAERRTLVLLYAGRARAALEQPDILAMADDPALFEEIGRALGWEEMFSYRILKLRAPPP